MATSVFKSRVSVDNVIAVSNRASTLEQPVLASAHSDNLVGRYSVKRTVVRPSSQFFVTLSIEEPILQLHSTIYTIVEGLELVSYCIAKEVSNNDNCVYHVHIYLELKDKDYLSNIVQFFTDSFACKMDVQSVKSRKSVLKYISKEDDMLLTNIKASSLSFFYQLNSFVKSTKKFDITHNFVVMHWNRYRFIERYYNEKKIIKPPWYGYNQYVDVNKSWNMDVAIWWNDWVVNGWFHKKKQLYLWGPPSVGKSTFVYQLLQSIPEYYIFKPDIGQFAFGLWDDRCKVVLFEDHNLDDFNRTHLKLMLEGHRFMASVKCSAPVSVCCKVPIIIISNDWLQDNVLSARLQVVHASKAFWISEAHVLSKVQSESILLDSDEDAVVPTTSQ